ncbi:MaoC/PaaZ C-terminal domain-containing protein [Oceanobacillus saliphilus]|uniref:MaoC/PaaZ C-terminal domain-containing protein n=1 Tax=Oceanobacillus saliphilus TaxID=2925834 RepID=UPI00201D9703|nr:MaoC/PaaZ C-terminal domain-containing protein [Oceanobacillus saliphilus]
MEQEVKATFEKLTKPPITRMQLVKYAGASGDFNPIHTDEEFALNSPMKGLIAHGMLSMGFLTQYVEKLVGDPLKIKEITVQFRSIVRPSDVISLEAKEVVSINNLQKLELHAKNQHESIVLKGEAFIDK